MPQWSFLSASLFLQLKKLWGKDDPFQTKHHLFEAKLLFLKEKIGHENVFDDILEMREAS